ncbi:hypothetical protein R1flu_025999 [Riccia fluitans]|uniref:Uncharacterized protein n=1 Tax=Riccia fluitans TaxID=41844 RepID=A0ABD1XHP8_9MARC
MKFRDAEEITQIWNDVSSLGEGSWLCSQDVAGEKQLIRAQMLYMLFTSLGDNQARGIYVTPYLTVSQYGNLAKTKGILLVREMLSSQARHLYSSRGIRVPGCTERVRLSQFISAVHIRFVIGPSVLEFGSEEPRCIQQSA